MANQMPGDDMNANTLDAKLEQFGKLVWDIANTDIYPRPENDFSRDSASNIIGSISTVKLFLTRLCPSIEVHADTLLRGMGEWRFRNVVSVLEMTKQLLNQSDNSHAVAAHPRLIYLVVNEGSMSRDPTILSMWAHLLASSCVFEKEDERGVAYASLLARLSPGQAALLCYVTNIGDVDMDDMGMVRAQRIYAYKLGPLMKIGKAEVLSELQMDLDYLAGMKLIDVGWRENANRVGIRVRAMGVQLVNRCTYFSGV